MENAIFEALLGGGGTLAIAALLFYLYRAESARREAITERYITHLESEAADDVDEDATERPTRPVRTPAMKKRIGDSAPIARA